MNGSRVACRVVRAEGAAAWRCRRPKPHELAEHPRLREVVERKLASHWSPQQISGRLVHDHPDDQETRVSHENTCRAPFVQARGALRKGLATCLCSGRTHGGAQAPGVLHTGEPQRQPDLHQPQPQRARDARRTVA